MHWDRIRIFLAVARSGQLLSAARSLGLNHATVGRQLTALEEELQVKLLERSASGCMLTAAGEAMLATAERVETEFLQYESGLAGTIRGNVRVGAPDGIGNYFLAAHLAALAAKHAELLVQLLPLPRSFSLTRREADIVIALERPTQVNLIAQKLTDYTLSFYASEGYLESVSEISEPEDLDEHLFITYVDNQLFTPALDYGREFSASLPRRFECGSVVGQMNAVCAGAGVAILHDYAAIEQPNLRRILPGIQFTRSYWMVSHPDTHRSHRVAEVRRHIAEAVAGARSKFCPRGAAPAWPASDVPVPS